MRLEKCSSTRIHSRRFRELARDGFLLLTTPGAHVDPPTSLAAPVRVCELAAIDPTGALATALDARRGEVWVIRPDAHVAAVLEQPTRQALEDALHRAIGAA